MDIFRDGRSNYKNERGAAKKRFDFQMRFGLFSVRVTSESGRDISLFHFNSAVPVLQSINFGMSNIMHGKNEYLPVNLDACSHCLFKTYLHRCAGRLRLQVV